MPRTFWYIAIKHSARMMNMIPGKYKGKLASPFMLVQRKRPDTRTWIPLFSLCYFHHNKDSDASRSKHQAHTMDGIVVGCSSTSNAIMVYNPRNQCYYKPDSYKLDPYHLPSSVYTNIVYNGGLFVSLHRDDTPQISEPYPPGTRVIKTDPDNGIMRSGTVMDIPLDLSTSPHYLVLFDDGTSTSVTTSKMPSLISKLEVNVSDTSHLLPPFLRKNSKITFDHDGQFHKGYLTQSDDGTYYFSYKSHTNKKHAEWSVPLPNLTSTWHDLCINRTLLPGHTASSLLRDPSAHFVSAANLLRECPHSLLFALNASHPDRDVWLAIFREEKNGIILMDTYDTINMAQYRALCKKGAPKAIPTMCVLTIKPDEMMRPHCAKSHIVVLGNHKDCLWTKSDKYAPVLCSTPYASSSAWLLNRDGFSNRAIARTRSVKVFYRLTKSPSSNLPLKTLMLRKTSTGYSSAHCTVSVAALDIGMTRSKRSSTNLDFAKTHTTLVSSHVLSLTPRTRPTHLLHHH